MARRVVSSRPGRSTGGQSVKGTPPGDPQSGYGLTRVDSIGYNPRNPYAYMATKGGKKYFPGTAKEED